MVNRFTLDTAVEDLGDGRYRARLDAGWWVEAGPNGGYLAAVLVRACEHAIADPSRTCRSFTTHFLSRASEGEAIVEVTVERSGRSMSSVSARLVQNEKVIATALGAFSTGRPGPSFVDVDMPDVPPPHEVDAPMFSSALPASAIPEMARRYDQRWVIGDAPFSGSDEALLGGWIRLADDRPVDASLLVAFSDAWMPAMFARVSGPWAITTVDLTVHVRALPPVDHDGWCLVRFRSDVSVDGFCEEDGEIWSSDGTLLAQTRQLAAIIAIG